MSKTGEAAHKKVRRWRRGREARIGISAAVVVAAALVGVGYVADWATETWRSIALVSMALGQTIFAVLYVTWPWWKNFLGQALFFKAISFGVLLDALLVGRMYDWPYEDATFTVLYYVVAVAIWWQVFAFLRVRYNARGGVSGNGSS